MKLKMILSWLCAGLLAASCSTGIPKNVTPVTGFDADRYLGTWYEIARLDHRFERNLDNVTATYSKRDDGGIRVLNKGFDTKKSEWDRAEGRAYFVSDRDQGHLKVSFFGPFYGSYVVFDLDENYQQSYVSGPDKSYLWYLSRTPTVTEQDKIDFINKANSLGYETGGLIWVDQSRNMDTE